ncbi:MAG: hydantoinase/oxoprolinase family protein [Actinomycetota bacterium]|nr:hydantoinase/oxoprolinase family protein [Actinomycetota bacterium]
MSFASEGENRGRSGAPESAGAADTRAGTVVGIDIGGTFTDTVMVALDGTLESFKTPTTPGALLEGLLTNLREAAGSEDLDDFLRNVSRIAHGTTAATNAYIERRGAKTALLTTRGFEDTIFMQRQMGMTAGLSSNELTDYSLRQVPEPLAPRSLVFGVRERIDYRGAVIGELREEDVRAAARAIRENGAEAVAVCLLWSFKNPDHERRTAEILRSELPEVYVSVSSELVPRLGEYERTATTLVNAYLGPMIASYCEALAERLGETNLHLLDSSGSVMTAAQARRAPVRLLLSGPSGGVRASQYLGQALGHRNVITFDMGGTSTDVGLIVEGEPLQRIDTEMGKYHLLLPMIDVTAIGAGGGSIARVEAGGYLRVGPASAGADPGPACYGHGGTHPTVTDADLLLGILDPGNFLGGRLPLDVDAAHRAVARHVAEPLGVPVQEAAAGIKRIVDGRMADLLRMVTLERGHDPREFVLYAFGGAGPAHAPAFALEVVDKVLVPASQSVHSALGAASSDVSLIIELAAPMRVGRERLGHDLDAEEIESIFDGLEDRALRALEAQRVPPERRELERSVEVRFVRQTKALSVPYRGSPPALVTDFLGIYARRYGDTAVPEAAGFELVTFVVTAHGRLRRPTLARLGPEAGSLERARRASRPVYDPVAGALLPTAVFAGEELRPRDALEGPAVIEYATTTLVVCSGQRAQVDDLLGIAITGT